MDQGYVNTVIITTEKELGPVIATISKEWRW